MEGGERLVEISLDSVLRKAAELEESLKGCKTKMESSLATAAMGRSASAVTSQQPAGKGPPKKPPAFTRAQSHPLPLEGGRTGPPVSTDLADQWQKLTAYIVSLEKEVHYYKQLLQDVQLHQKSSNLLGRPTGHGTPAKCPAVEGLLDEDPESRALCLVFSYLSLEELMCPVALVCRKWYRVTRHPCFWKEVVMSETVVQPEVLFKLSEWCTSTERLVLHGLMPPLAAPDQDLQSYIATTRGSLEPGLKALMEASRDAMTTITITECNLMATERALWLASVNCPNLRSLTYCSEEFPPSSESLWSLANGCRHLQYLNLPPVPESPNAKWFNDNCLFVIAHAWPNLLSLTVGGNAITPHGLKEIAERNQKLQFLEIIYGPSLHKDAAEELCSSNGFHPLITLILNFTPASHLALQVFIESCPNLQTLELHTTMSCYSEADSNNITNYSKILTNIKKLKKHSRGKEVFHLFEH